MDQRAAEWFAMFVTQIAFQLVDAVDFLPIRKLDRRIDRTALLFSFHVNANGFSAATDCIVSKLACVNNPPRIEFSGNRTFCKSPSLTRSRP